MAAELELYDKSKQLADQPLPCRYLQLPTVVVRVLREYFGQTDSRWLRGAAHFSYRGENQPMEDAELTGHPLEIFRTDEYRGDAHRSLPKLVVRRNAVGTKIEGLGHGHRMGALAASQRGEKQIAVNYFGSVVVFALSSVPGEGDLLAAEVEQLLQHLADHIRCELLLEKLAVTQLGETGELAEFPGFFAVPVVLDYIYEDNVYLSRGNFPIRKIRLDIE